MKGKRLKLIIITRQDCPNHAKMLLIYAISLLKGSSMVPCNGHSESCKHNK